MLCFQDKVIPVRSQNRTDGRFANLAASAFTMFLQQVIEGSDLIYPDQGKQILPGYRQNARKYRY